MNLHITEDLVDDVITEALHHVNRKSVEHHITVRHKEDYLLAKMDAKLMVQVIINIVDNAIKYTPKGSNILIKTWKQGDKAVISIADDGDGIHDEMKERVFDMFYSGANKIADSRRSLNGLVAVPFHCKCTRRKNNRFGQHTARHGVHHYITCRGGRNS